MKKLTKIAIVFSLFLLVGCGEKKVELEKNISSTIDIDDKEAKMVCYADYDYSELDYVMGAKYAVFADGENKVTKVISREIIESNDGAKLDEFETYMSENHDAAKKYGGYDSNIARSSNRVTSDVTIDYTYFDMEQFTEDNKGNDKVKIELTLDSLESQYVSLGATCERK